MIWQAEVLWLIHISCLWTPYIQCTWHGRRRKKLNVAFADMLLFGCKEWSSSADKMITCNLPICCSEVPQSFLTKSTLFWCETPTSNPDVYELYIESTRHCLRWVPRQTLADFRREIFILVSWTCLHPIMIADRSTCYLHPRQFNELLLAILHLAPPLCSLCELFKHQ